MPRKRHIAITPLIDVVFILLLFFMLSSAFSRTKQIELQTAVGKSPSVAPSAIQRLLLLEQDLVQFQGERYRVGSPEFAAVMSKLAGEKAEVIVAAAARVEVQKLIFLVDQTKAAGIVNIQLAESVAH